jgi:plasmid stability protein
MSTQTLTIELPDGIFSRLKSRADRANRTIEAELVDVLASAIPGEELPAYLVAEFHRLDQMDDEPLREFTRQGLAKEIADRLESLNLKNQKSGLTDIENESQSEALEAYERHLVLRARAFELLKERGHDLSPGPPFS